MGILDFLNTPYTVFVVLLLFSFLPPIAFLIWVRNTERYAREPWFSILRVFVWGAVFAVIIAILLSLALNELYRRIVPLYDVLGDELTIPTLVAVLLVAPFVEEAAKAIGIYAASFNINQVEDGIVYGAASGLGFSATENLFYGVAVLLTFDPGSAIMLIMYRSISSTLLHASATSMTGYGIGRSIVSDGRLRVAPYYMVAVVMHSLFNFFASFGVLFETSLGENAYIFGVVVATVFAILAFSHMRAKIAKG